RNPSIFYSLFFFPSKKKIIRRPPLSILQLFSGQHTQQKGGRAPTLRHQADDSELRQAIPRPTAGESNSRSHPQQALARVACSRGCPFSFRSPFLFLKQSHRSSENQPRGPPAPTDEPLSLLLSPPAAAARLLLFLSSPTLFLLDSSSVEESNNISNNQQFRPAYFGGAMTSKAKHFDKVGYLQICPRFVYFYFYFIFMCKLPILEISSSSFCSNS
ncbi:hypothetical protein AABB24_015732, partial [Solanum stoloniferum]